MDYRLANLHEFPLAAILLPISAIFSLVRALSLSPFRFSLLYLFGKPVRSPAGEGGERGPNWETHGNERY